MGQALHSSEVQTFTELYSFEAKMRECTWADSMCLCAVAGGPGRGVLPQGDAPEARRGAEATPGRRPRPL